MSESTVKNFIFLLMGVALCLPLFGANYKDLSDDCHGQILCPQSGDEPLRFIGFGEDRHWKCALLGDSLEMAIAPADVAEIFPLYTDSEAFDVISFTLCQVMPTGKEAVGSTSEERKTNAYERSRRMRICKALLKSYPSTRTSLLQRCLEEIDREEKELGNILSQYGANSRYSGDKIIERFQNGTPFIAIESALSSLDFQIAVPCFFRLQEVVRKVTERKMTRPYQLDLERLIEKEGDRILDAYALQAEQCGVRVTKYLDVFPKAPGHWNETAPTSLDELQKMALLSLKDSQKSLGYSSTLDFPNWGAAMLGVFRLFPNAAIIRVQTELFDKELQNYSDKHK